MDSIRENEKLEDMVTALKMELDADINNELCIVLVEGKDDIKFINRIFGGKVVCYESFSGKTGLQELIQHASIQENRIIAIRDKDYANVDEFPKRLFCYDTCCMETMLLANEEVAEGIYKTYYKGMKDQNAFLLNAMRELAPLSVLREENEEHGYGIDFKRIGLGDCIDESQEKVKLDVLFSRINQQGLTKDECISKAAAWRDDELLEKTNGHDLCKFLGKVCGNEKADMGEGKLRDALICSYRKSDFLATYLYNSLNNYQVRHHLSFV